MDILNASYWDHRYKTHQIGWDLGSVSPPLKAYIDQLEDTTLRILIPGGGNSYEAEYLFKSGFKNVYVIDVSRTALHNIKTRVSDFPSDQLIEGDFFELQKSFDLILEQTFFCALNPSLRTNYVKQMHRLLSDKGRLVGLLFNVPLNEDHPPFGGSKGEYLERFKGDFDILTMADCYNSHPSRAGRELFFKVKKK